MGVSNFMAAASPCPPPPPVELSCPVPAPVVGGTLFPWCMVNDCKSYGYQKAIDGKTSSFAGMSITGYHYADDGQQVNSYMQFDLGSLRSDITAVRLVGPIRSTYSTMPENVSVYLSATSDFKAGTLCDTGIEFVEPGQTALIDCPAGASARYLTAFYNVPNQRLTLMEVTPYYDGECQAQQQAGHQVGLPSDALGPSLLPDLVGLA